MSRTLAFIKFSLRPRDRCIGRKAVASIALTNRVGRQAGWATRSVVSIGLQSGDSELTVITHQSLTVLAVYRPAVAAARGPGAFTDARRAYAAWRVSSLAASRAFGAPLRGLTGLQPIPPRAFSAAPSWL